MMKGVVSKTRDRKAECTCGDKNRLQFLGLPAPEEHQSNISSFKLSRTSDPTRSNSQREGKSSGKATLGKKKCKAIPHSGSKTPDREAERHKRERKASDGRPENLSLVETFNQLLDKFTVLPEELHGGKPYIQWL